MTTREIERIAVPNEPASMAVLGTHRTRRRGTATTKAHESLVTQTLSHDSRLYRESNDFEPKILFSGRSGGNATVVAWGGVFHEHKWNCLLAAGQLAFRNPLPANSKRQNRWERLAPLNRDGETATRG